jgi:hypothetical protein
VKRHLWLWHRVSCPVVAIATKAKKPLWPSIRYPCHRVPLLTSCRVPDVPSCTSDFLNGSASSKPTSHLSQGLIILHCSARGELLRTDRSHVCRWKNWPSFSDSVPGTFFKVGGPIWRASRVPTAVPSLRLQVCLLCSPSSLLRGSPSSAAPSSTSVLAWDLFRSLWCQFGILQYPLSYQLDFSSSRSVQQLSMSDVRNDVKHIVWLIIIYYSYRRSYRSDWASVLGEDVTAMAEITITLASSGKSGVDQPITSLTIQVRT